MVTFVKTIETMELTDRIKYLMKVNNLSASAFAEKVGVQPSSISHILSERNKPSLEFIQKILTKFPNVNADWLITGNSQIKEPPIQPKVNIVKKTSSPLTSNSKSLDATSVPISEKQIKKIVILYTDNTFEEIIK